MVPAWVFTGPLFGFSNTWQLLVNTFTTVAAFLMVFLIRNTQNRDAKVFHLKLDELLRAMHSARTGFVDLEELSDAELKQVAEEFRLLHAKYGDPVSRVHRAIHEKAGSRRQRD